MLNIRLDEEMERKLDLIRKKKGVSKTTLVKEALDKYIQGEIQLLSAYELGKDLFGTGEGGSPDGSVNYKKEIKSKLHGKFPY